MIPASKLSPALSEALRQYVSANLETLRAYRTPWWVHWAMLAEMYLPRRYRWFITPNNFNRGTPLNQSIKDETTILAARTCASGMLSGLTSPTRPWFALGLFGIDKLPEGPAKSWLAECTDRMHQVYSNSGVYQSLGQVYHDDCVFGSAGLIQYEHSEKIIQFQNPCLGEFFFGLNDANEVDTLYREFTYTAKQCVNKFGYENLSTAIQQAYKTPASRQTEFVICHAIEPNSMVYQAQAPIGYAVPKKFKFREVYWEQVQANGTRAAALIQCAGFNEIPFNAFRWDTTSNDAYGRSPGMDGLPAARQLQLEQMRKAEAIEKMVRPPMVASVAMKNEPTDILPGGITYVPTMDASTGFTPAFKVEPRIQEFMEDIKEVQQRINSIFFVDLFMMISNLQTVRTATEIDARREEKLVQLGPVIERTEFELDRMIMRTFSIMMRRGLFPPPPPEIQGMGLSIKYVSMLAEAQRAASTAILERFTQFVITVAGSIQPQVWDTVNSDELIDVYADRLGVPPNVLRSLKEIMQIRAQRMEQQKAAAALQVGQAAATGAATLAKADVGGGQNALQMATAGG